MEKDISQFKKDKDGLYYIDNESILTPFSFNELITPYTSRRPFYMIKGNDDYIIKDSRIRPILFNQYKTRKMLINLNNINENTDDIDFPIGYYLKDNKISGTIVPYYKDSLSLRRLLFLHDKKEVANYYNHYDTNVENIASICLEILDLIKQLFEQDIFYTDIHSGNFLLYNNSIKIIDFDPEFVHFKKSKDWYYQVILRNYGFLVHSIWCRLGYYNVPFHFGDDFCDAKEKVKSIRDYYKRG